MRDKHRRRKRGRVLAILVAGALTGMCVVAGCTAMRGERLERIAGKDAADKIEIVREKAYNKIRSGYWKIREKAGSPDEAADKTKRAAKKAKGFFERLAEKAGGADGISDKVKKIFGRFVKSGSKIDSAEDIALTSLDNEGYAYRFEYNGEKYRAVYTASYDTWTIYDSYKIINEHDMEIICQALIDEHPVHGSDLESYRTAEDMAYEWQQHNIVYDLAPDGNHWKSRAKDVDLDPYDQGKSYKEIYEDRTGKKFDIKNFV